MKFDKNTKILIVGLGLIGGSYAKALSDEGYFVGAIDKKKSSVEYALKNGLIQVGETSVKKDFVKDFDLIVFALYPHDFINWIKEYQSSIKSGALITDVTGVKSFVVENVQNCTFKGEVGVEQAACQYTHEQGRVDLLRYQCQSNGDYGRKKGPRSVVEALRAKLSALGGESGYAEHYQRNGHHYDSRQRLAGR